LTQSIPANENPGCLSLFSGRGKEPYQVKKVPVNEDDASSGVLPYEVNQKFLSSAELSFYLQAREVLSGKYIVCPKVSLAELFHVSETDGRQWQLYKNKIIQKRVDFVVFDSATMKPLYAIELDNSNYDLPDRQQRDEFVDHVFESANLPLVRVDWQSGYSHEEMVETLLTPLLHKDDPPAANLALSRNIPLTANPPPLTEKLDDPRLVICPNCGSTMRKTVATTGAHVGEYYWVCSRYPQCPTFYPASEGGK
jgi:hypothetical protein